MKPEHQGPFKISSYSGEDGKPTLLRQSDGSLTVSGADREHPGEYEYLPVLRVLMSVKPKHGTAWRTSDPDQEAFAAHVVAVLNANPFPGREVIELRQARAAV